MFLPVHEQGEDKKEARWRSGEARRKSGRERGKWRGKHTFILFTPGMKGRLCKKYMSNHHVNMMPKWVLPLTKRMEIAFHEPMREAKMRSKSYNHEPCPLFYTWTWPITKPYLIKFLLYHPFPKILSSKSLSSKSIICTTSKSIICTTSKFETQM